MIFPNAHDFWIKLEWLAMRLKDIATHRRLIRECEDKYDIDIGNLRAKLKEAEAKFQKELDGSSGERDRIREMMEEIIS